MGSRQKTITVREEQAEWLDEHPAVNLSGIVREAIDREIEMRDMYGEINDVVEKSTNNATPDDEKTI